MSLKGNHWFSAPVISSACRLMMMVLVLWVGMMLGFYLFILSGPWMPDSVAFSHRKCLFPEFRCLLPSPAPCLRQDAHFVNNTALIQVTWLLGTHCCLWHDFGPRERKVFCESNLIIILSSRMHLSSSCGQNNN